MGPGLMRAGRRLKGHLAFARAGGRAGGWGGWVRGCVGVCTRAAGVWVDGRAGQAAGGPVLCEAHVVPVGLEAAN